MSPGPTSRKRPVEKLGKRLAYVLRHAPGELTLDPAGWTDVAALMKALDISFEELEQTVQSDSKGRFTIEDGRIRANQGHSLPNIEAFQPAEPPEWLFHGTTQERWPQIQASGGLKPMARHHVHLSADEATARQVGARRRRETLLLLTIDAKRMQADGHPFWISSNGVWLAHEVPCSYMLP